MTSRKRKTVSSRSPRAHPRVRNNGAGRTAESNRRLEFTKKHAIALVGVIVTALITAVVSVVVSRIDSGISEQEAAHQPLLVVQAMYDFPPGAGSIWVSNKIPTKSLIEKLTGDRSLSDQVIADAVSELDAVQVEDISNSAISYTPIRISMTTTQNDEVLIKNMRVEPIECQSPIRRTIIAVFPQGAYSTPQLRVNLDDPTLGVLNAGGLGPATPYFNKNFLTVGRNDPQVVELEASSTRQYCEWQLAIDAQMGQRSQAIQVRLPDGQPFRTTAWVSRYQYQFAWPWPKGSSNSLTRITDSAIRKDIP
jgi:hypothetical protein